MILFVRIAKFFKHFGQTLAKIYLLSHLKIQTFTIKFDALIWCYNTFFGPQALRDGERNARIGLLICDCYLDEPIWNTGQLGLRNGCGILNQKFDAIKHNQNQISLYFGWTRCSKKLRNISERDF